MPAAEDEARVRAVAGAARGLRLMLDANQGYSPEQSLGLLRRLRGRGIVPVLFEQPAAAEDYAGLRAVSRHGGVPVAAGGHVINMYYLPQPFITGLLAMGGGIVLLIGGMLGIIPGIPKERRYP